MNKQIGLILIATGLAGLCLAGHNEHDWPVRDREIIEKTMTLSGQPARVVVDNIDGYVHLKGVGGSQVRVTAHKIIRAETDNDLQESKREVKLELTEKPGTVSIYYAAPWRCDGNNQPCHGEQRHFYNVTYDIDVEVPRDARVVVSTVNNGDIRIANIAGNFEVSDINGGIDMNAISGYGEVHTINGPVAVRFAKNPAAPSVFKTLNGQLDVYFQPGLSADLLFKTFNGQIFTDFDITSRAIQLPKGEQRDGKFVYHSKGFAGARVGQGGPELTFDAFNGNIRLHQGGN